VDAKAKLAAFGLVGSLEELRLDRGGDVLGRPHLRHATLHPLGDAAAFDRRVAVGDDRVAARPERIQHAGPGRGGVGFDIENGGERGVSVPSSTVELPLPNCTEASLASSAMIPNGLRGWLRNSPVRSEA
jgi:hypothetical protein